MRRVLPWIVLAGLAWWGASVFWPGTEAVRTASTPAATNAQSVEATQKRPRPVPPTPKGAALSAEDELKTFKLAESVRVQVAASEPMVQAPVSAVFDEDGRLWVVEMTTYMQDIAAHRELEPHNRVVILEDTDGDGVFDRSTVFMDNLVLPRAVAPCFGGALVLEPPNLFFCKDTDGDGKADVKTEVLGGFLGRDNPEHAGNGLLFGLDNWYHLSQHKLELRYDGSKAQTRATPVVGQWGITQDDVGRLYYVPNSNTLLADAWPKHAAAREPGLSATPGIAELVAPDSTTWPIHPTTGVNRGYQPATLRDDGTLATLTAACGPAAYRAGALGADFRGNVFICEPAGNLVKRLRLSDRDGVPAAVNAYAGREYLASTDERFRPVNLCVGWDGALYVVDMYRGVIQHKTYLTEYLKGEIKSRELEQPLSMGRIFRVSNAGAPATPRPRLSQASNAELFKLLSHADGWWRDTAQRLLVQRHAVGVVGATRELLLTPGPLLPRVHALWTLVGLGVADRADVLAALGASEPELRAAGAEAALQMPKDEILAEKLAALVQDPDRRVRVLAAAAVGPAIAPAGLGELLRAVRSAGGWDDRMRRTALFSGLRGREVELLRALLADPGWLAEASDVPALREAVGFGLRAGKIAAREVVELAGAMAGAGDDRASALVGCIADELKLYSDEPRVIELDREPSAWIAASKTGEVGAAVLRRGAAYFDWPGRPLVARARRTKPLTPEEQRLFTLGREVFVACAACHMQDGRGSPGVAPSLVGSAFAQARADVPVRIVLHGLEGTYDVGGAPFTGAMSPLPLDDRQIAGVLTFIRRSWGNRAEAVSPELVASVREQHRGRGKSWTRDELAKVKN